MTGLEGLGYARGLRAGVGETCVLAVNENGLRRAERHVPAGEEDLWIDLRPVGGGS